MSPPPHHGTIQTRNNSSSMQQISQHKRSLSFNHHLSYNQVQQQQQAAQNVTGSPQSMLQPAQHQAYMKPSSTPQHQLLTQRKDIVPTSPASIRSAQSKSNWSITSLRPSNPLRPCFTSSGNSQSSSHGAVKYELSTKKVQPTYEEDALVLRVIEAYSIAFQNTSRNTVHSAELDDGTPTPTLRQMFQALRQLQFEMQEIKSQLNQERTLRTDLQRMLMKHTEGCGTN